jgi:hypothetical protein
MDGKYPHLLLEPRTDAPSAPFRNGDIIFMQIRIADSSQKEFRVEL